VGHAFGGDHVRAFAELFLEDVAGLVLVEADASDVESADLRRRDDEGGQSFTTNSSEYVQFDEPEVVEGAVRDLWEIARAARAGD
jgi:pimeloyl-ACP methyl ester carboxylesterase